MRIGEDRTEKIFQVKIWMPNFYTALHTKLFIFLSRKSLPFLDRTDSRSVTFRFQQKKLEDDDENEKVPVKLQNKHTSEIPCTTIK